MPRSLDLPFIGVMAAALMMALVVTLVTTPVAKNLAIRVKAVDIPKNGRHMHDHPTPRMDGLAIFLGFLFSVPLSLDLSAQVRGMLLEAVIIVVLSTFDDVYSLRAVFRFAVQIIVALATVLSGNVIETLSDLNMFSADPYQSLGVLAVSATVIWIAVITNAVNLIDGLSSLAYDISTISPTTLLVIVLMVSEGNVAILMTALADGCIGFLPYNMDPAKIFMRDTGSTFLGYILAAVSIRGLSKFYTIISSAVPFLIPGLPIFGTCPALICHIAHGQSPMHANRSHVHHRLIDMDFSQKWAVTVLYVISTVSDLSIVVLTTSGPVKAMLLLLALCFAGAISARIFLGANGKKNDGEKPDEKGEEK